MPSNIPATIRIYRVANPDLLSRHADDFARILFGMMTSADDTGRMLSVSPASGFLFFSDSNTIWQEGSAGTKLLSDKATAEAAARKFLTHANQLIASDASLRRDRCPPLFPDSVRPFATKLMMRPGNGTPDHWLSQFAVDLTMDITGQTAPVLGAAIEVRIGAEGKVVGLSSRWRPVISSESTRLLDLPGQPPDPVPSPADVMRANFITPIDPPVKPAIPTAGSEQDTDLPEPVIVYLLQDESAPQSAIAPYHAYLAGHDGWFYPATTYSLLLNIVQTSGSDGVLLEAQVAGGSGSYTYQWASWSPDVFGEGSQNLGEGSETQVPKGVHNVVLRVTDQATRITAQVESMVYSLG